MEKLEYTFKACNVRPWLHLSNKFLLVMIDTSKKVIESIEAPISLRAHTHSVLAELQYELASRN